MCWSGPRQGSRRSGRGPLARNSRSNPNSRSLSENQGQTIFTAADHDNFGVRALGQSLGCFDTFPLEQLRTDALRDDLLEISNAGGFDSLSLCFLFFFLQAEVHG